MKCDCCGKEFSHQWVKARYTLWGYVYDYFYCSDNCKQDHRLKLIRESGL